MIEFIDVHKSFGKHPVLNGVSFRIERGETFAVIGRSGCGKSVTLKLMVGLLQPDRGKIMVDGKELTAASDDIINNIRRKFGFIFQGSALLNSLNVADNIALPLREHRVLPEPEITKKVSEVLGFLSLGHIEKVMPSELSGGMRKRVAIARAIISQPEVILYDEPTTGLDPIMANTINTLMVQMKRHFKATSVLVTHDMKSVFAVADRIVMLYQGKIVRTGRTTEFQNSSDPYIKQFIEGAAEGPFQDEDEEKIKQTVFQKDSRMNKT